MTLVVEIPDELLERNGLTEADIRLRVALSLFEEESITLGQASALAGLHQFQFQKELAKRQIPIHYDVEEFEQDIKSLNIKFK